MTMSDDLVRRLRKVEPDAPGERTRWYRNPDGPEAANRIEQLEAALREIACDGEDCHCQAPQYCSYGIARAALGEKKDG
jgi:hypothetical protein